VHPGVTAKTKPETQPKEPAGNVWENLPVTWEVCIQWWVLSRSWLTYADEQRSYCANLGGNVKVNFNIKRIGNSKKSLDFDACYDGLRKEIEGCNHGGRTKYANWEYT
jgi:hypothetical protein